MKNEMTKHERADHPCGWLAAWFFRATNQASAYSALSERMLRLERANAVMERSAR